jgi:preprotein translocase subunit YajC
MQAAPVTSEAGEATGQGAADQGSPFSLIFLFVILFGIMYVFLILPQKRREKSHRAMLSELKKNDRVVTAGGLHGIVMSVKEGSVVLKIDDDKDIKVTVNTGSIAQVVPKEQKDDEDKK